MVSIPYRLATNIELTGFTMDEIEVSIPYRLATNVKAKIKYVLMSYYSIKKLEDDELRIYRKALFQFLIGWLQTPPNQAMWQNCFLVSIPYRLATNSKSDFT